MGQNLLDVCSENKTAKHSIPVFDAPMFVKLLVGGTQSDDMATFDTNKDGTLSPKEMTAGIKAELKTCDTDANGALSLEEFAVMHAAHTRPMTVRTFQM